MSEVHTTALRNIYISHILLKVCKVSSTGRVKSHFSVNTGNLWQQFLDCGIILTNLLERKLLFHTAGIKSQMYIKLQLLLTRYCVPRHKINHYKIYGIYSLLLSLGGEMVSLLITKNLLFIQQFDFFFLINQQNDKSIPVYILLSIFSHRTGKNITCKNTVLLKNWHTSK